MSVLGQSELTDAQHKMIGAIDDTAEHVAWEFDPEEWEGIGTCGFAHIGGIDGRSSFVRAIKSLAELENDIVVERAGRDGYAIANGSLAMVLRPSYKGGYRLGITNVQELANGPSHQRISLREHLHRLVLNRMRKHGYLDDARVRSRVD